MSQSPPNEAAKEEVREISDLVVVRVQPSDVASFLLQKIGEQLKTTGKDTEITDTRRKLIKLSAEFSELVNIITQNYKLVAHAATPVEVADTVLEARLIQVTMLLENVISQQAQEVNKSLDALFSATGHGGKVDVKAKQRLLESIDKLFSAALMVPPAISEASIVLFNMIVMNSDPQFRPGLVRMLTGLDIIKMEKKGRR